MEILGIKKWGLEGFETAPLVIAGPCSAETEEQVLKTCKMLSKYPKIRMLRAGIWKPRTRPNSFEGVGTKGLVWLKRAGLECNLPVCTEVANPAHVEAALNAGIDVLWLGARTTVNPFAVQAIADALKGIDIPIMVKNPINPDLNLWIGALERLHQAGVQKLAAIHRGFSAYDTGIYRNLPQWEIPIELARRIPNLDIICDPSHIGGNRSLIAPLAQQALNLNLKGAMIEAHIDPDNAWSDAKQQITPDVLGDLLEGLEYRKKTSNNPIFNENMQQFRKIIDTIDDQLMDLLAKRMSIVREIGTFKQENNVAILQMKRWIEIYQKCITKASTLAFSKEFVESFINSVHKESIRQQNEIMNLANSLYLKK